MIAFCLVSQCKQEYRQHIKNNSDFLFLFCFWLCLGVQNACRKIASVYISVHIYIVTTAFCRDVPCFCFCMPRRGSTFREMHKTTRDTETAGAFNAHIRHKCGDPIVPDWTLSTQLTPTVLLLGYNYDLKSWEMIPVTHATAPIDFSSVFHDSDNAKLESI